MALLLGWPRTAPQLRLGGVRRRGRWARLGAPPNPGLGLRGVPRGKALRLQSTSWRGPDERQPQPTRRGCGQGDTHLPYIHFFSFDFFVEILQNQIATLLRNPFYKKCDMHVKNSWFFKWCRTQPKWDPALGIRTILIRCKTISHFFLCVGGNSNDYISYT